MNGGILPSKYVSLYRESSHAVSQICMNGGEADVILFQTNCVYQVICDVAVLHISTHIGAICVVLPILEDLHSPHLLISMLKKNFIW